MYFTELNSVQFPSSPQMDIIAILRPSKLINSQFLFQVIIIWLTASARIFHLTVYSQSMYSPPTSMVVFSTAFQVLELNVANSGLFLDAHCTAFLELQI